MMKRVSRQSEEGVCYGSFGIPTTKITND